jgi:hypothetical protein
MVHNGTLRLPRFFRSLSIQGEVDTVSLLAQATLRCRPLLLAALLLSLWTGTVRADFTRGDANRDGEVDLGDAVATLFAVFLQSVPLSCRDAADSNDDGSINVLDAIRTLEFLFQNGEIPYPSPFVAPGPDTNCDALDCFDAGPVSPAIIISEIHYNPLDERTEFVEIHNRTDVEIDLTGYQFNNGISYTIPDGTVIPPRGYLLVLAIPEFSAWNSQPEPKLGPWEQNLGNNGERLTLANGPCEFETVRYDDRAPWPIGPDGLHKTLERIDYRAAADDHHAWRSSLVREGTPGAENSTLGTPTHPTIIASTITPEFPSSADPVAIEIVLDSPLAEIASITLNYQILERRAADPFNLPVEVVTRNSESVTVTAVIPAAPSEAVVRYNLAVELSSGESLFLPHPGEPVPGLSYFVYDDNLGSTLPIMWLIPPTRPAIVPDAASIFGVAIKEADEDHPVLYDGTGIRIARVGLKVKFLKGAEYQGNRTLNILPERGQSKPFGGVGGPYSALLEHIGFTLYREAGGLAPEARWFRVVNMASISATRHTQRPIIQQPNERFAELNGLDPDGDIYKLDQGNWRKQTNVHLPADSMAELLAAISSEDPNVVRDYVINRFDPETFCAHSVISNLIDHGDNYGNNLFVYNDLSPEGRWMVIPWDLDVTMRSPLGSIGAPGGVIHGPYMAQPEFRASFIAGLRTQISPGGLFTAEAMNARTQVLESLLLDDLALLETTLETTMEERRQLITEGYAYIRQFVVDRVAKVQQQLPPE